MRRFYIQHLGLTALMMLFFAVLSFEAFSSDGKFQEDSERIKKLEKSIRDFHHLPIKNQNNRVIYNKNKETLDRLRRRTERRKKRKEQCERYQDSSFTLLKTSEGHCERLLQSISEAEKSLTITTWKLGVCKESHPLLFKVLKNARKKGVDINIYYNELSKSESGNYVLDDLKKINIEPIQIGCCVSSDRSEIF